MSSPHVPLLAPVPVDVEVSGLDLSMVGVILMVAGVIGVIVSLIWIDRATAPRTQRTIVEERSERI